MVQLEILNPSSHARAGYVSTNWPRDIEVVADATRIQLAGLDKQHVPFQVDSIEGERRLTFLLNAPVSGVSNNDNYRCASSIMQLQSSSNACASTASGVTAAVESNDATGRPATVVLQNPELTVRVSLIPGIDSKPWYAGAATSVQYGAERRELLDAFQWDWSRVLDHDPEKRCMQIEAVDVGPPDWTEGAPWEQTNRMTVPMFCRPYSICTIVSGPLRAGVNLRSEDFALPAGVHDMGPSKRARLRRALWIYAHGTFLMDRVSVESESPTENETSLLPFALRFFNCICLRADPLIQRYEFIPDWLAIGTRWGARQGYGFATDAHTVECKHPHPGYPVGSQAYNTFSWTLGPARIAQCLHLFMCQEDHFDNLTGQHWYDYIFRPLRARWV